MKMSFGKKTGIFMRMTAIAVSAVFFISCLSLDSDAMLGASDAMFDVELEDLHSPGGYATLDVETFTMPAHLGEVRYSHRGDGARTVIHIQDAHCNYFAQQKVSGVIDYLNKEYGVSMLNLEGGAGEYDLTVFTNISGGEIRREVAEYFLKRGEVNGAEFYAINNLDRVSLWGIENRELYLKNLAVYRDSLRYQEEVEGYLKELGHIFDNLKRHIFAQDLLKIDMAYSSYKAGNMEFREYLSFLIKNARERGISVKTFPNIYLIAQAMEKEDSVDFRKANAERTVLIDRMKSILSPAEMRELVSTTVKFKTKRISLKEFYNYLLVKARECGFDLSGYPALSGYIVYVSLFDAVDRFKVMEELDGLEKAVKEPLFRSDTERELDILSRNLALKDNIFKIMLTKNDFAYYESNKDSFSVERFLRFISREAPKYGITSRTSPGISRLDDYLAEITMFYEYSFERDEAFVENMLFSDVPEGGEAAIIMTGGFHTENLCALFEEQGYSYVSIMPKFTMEKDFVNPYFDLLAGQTADIQQMLSSALAQSAMMQIASMLNNLGEDVWGAEGLDNWRTSVVLLSFMRKEAGFEALQAGITGIDANDTELSVRIKGMEDSPIVVSRRALMNAVHQQYVDAEMENLSPEAFRDIDGIESITEKLKKWLSDSGLGSIAGEIDLLAEKNSQGENMVRTAEGISFRGHAGGRGIRVNSDLTGDERDAVILHEIIAGIYGDHFFAERVEEAFLTGETEVDLSRVPDRLDKPVWSMTDEERQIARRDYLASLPTVDIPEDRVEAGKNFIEDFRKANELTIEQWEELSNEQLIDLLFGVTEKRLLLAFTSSVSEEDIINRIMSGEDPAITVEDINDLVAMESLEPGWVENVREEIKKVKQDEIAGAIAAQLRFRGEMVEQEDLQRIMPQIIDELFLKASYIRNERLKEDDYHGDWTRLHELAVRSGASPRDITFLRKGSFSSTPADTSIESIRSNAQNAIKLILEILEKKAPQESIKAFEYIERLKDPDLSADKQQPNSVGQLLFHFMHAGHVTPVDYLMSDSLEEGERDELIDLFAEFYENDAHNLIGRTENILVAVEHPETINFASLAAGPYMITGDSFDEKMLNMRKALVFVDLLKGLEDGDVEREAWTTVYDQRVEDLTMLPEQATYLAPVAGNIGKFMVDGELVTNMGTREEVRNGTEYLVVTDRDSGIEARVQITREVSNEEVAGLVEELKKLKEGQPGMPNILTPDEKEKLGQIIDEITGKGISVIAMDERIMGHFGTNDKIYLNQELLVGSPLALLHELIHGFYPTVEGVSSHTLARGVGEDVRTSLQVLRREKYTTLNLAKEAGAEQFIRDLNEVTMETSSRYPTDDEKDLIRHNFDVIDERTIDVGVEKTYGAEILLFGLQDHMDPEGNLVLTSEIKAMQDKIRRGAYNIVFDETRNIMAKPSAENMARKTSRKYRRQWGVDTTYKAFEDTSEDGVRTVLNMALSEITRQDYGMVLIKCISSQSVDAFNARIEEEFSDLADRIVVIYSPVESPEEHNENVPRLLHMANQLLNYKRMETYFGLSAEDPMMVELGREMIEHLERAKYIGKDSIAEHLGKGVPSISALSVGDLSDLLKGLFRGAVRVTITKINWEEIRDYMSSMQAVYTSL